MLQHVHKVFFLDNSSLHVANKCVKSVFCLFSGLFVYAGS